MGAIAQGSALKPTRGRRSDTRQGPSLWNPQLNGQIPTADVGFTASSRSERAPRLSATTWAPRARHGHAYRRKPRDAVLSRSVVITNVAGLLTDIMLDGVLRVLAEWAGFAVSRARQRSPSSYSELHRSLSVNMQHLGEYCKRNDLAIRAIGLRVRSAWA